MHKPRYPGTYQQEIGHTVILTIVDRFSRGLRLVPLPDLPIAFQTAEILFLHVFRYFGIPGDIVSNWDPQFTSKVWKRLHGTAYHK